MLQRKNENFPDTFNWGGSKLGTPKKNIASVQAISIIKRLMNVQNQWVHRRPKGEIEIDPTDGEVMTYDNVMQCASFSRIICTPQSLPLCDCGRCDRWFSGCCSIRSRKFLPEEMVWVM